MSKVLVLLIFTLYLFEISFAEYDVELENENEMSELVFSRNPKLFNFFPFHGYKTEIPSHTSTKCFTSNSEWGHCLSRKQCSSIEGGIQTDTKCSNNNGICCIIKVSWNHYEPGIVTIKNNLTHIVTSSNLINQAIFLVPRQNGICQLRLDFKIFMLSPANENGACLIDSMTISGAYNLNPAIVLCGDIGITQHLYLHYGSGDAISINMDIADKMSKYDIVVTMIRCDSKVKAPDGCSQYYTEQNGDVKSFNYPNQQLNNQHYSVCVQASRGSQYITWSTCKESEDPLTDFFISGNAAGSVQAYCSGDRITIPGSVEGAYCGGTFNDVKTSAKPFALYVDFDHEEMSPLPTGPPSPNGCPYPFQCGENGVPLSPQPADHICLTPNACFVDVDHGVPTGTGSPNGCPYAFKCGENGIPLNPQPMEHMCPTPNECFVDVDPGGPTVSPSPNGCPYPFKCGKDGVPLEMQPMDGNCPTDHECIIPDVVPGRPTNEIVHDMSNTGFCLRFMKT